MLLLNDTPRALLILTLGRALLILTLGCALAGCADTLGECTVECTFDSDGSLSIHGPYDDYTESECDDQADQSESPSITTCVADWEAY